MESLLPIQFYPVCFCHEQSYVLAPQNVYGLDFPGETFRVLKKKEIKKYGKYRTRRLVLEAWDRMQEAINNGTEYVPMVDPPPAHPSVAHPMRDGRVYEGSGLVIEAEPVAMEQLQPARYEEQAPTKLKEEKPVQPSFTDFGLYKCESCGKMVMGFEKEKHADEAHRGKPVEWKKLR